MRNTILAFVAWSGILGTPVAVAASGDVDPGFAYPRPSASEPDSSNAVALPDGYLVLRQTGAWAPGFEADLELTRIDRDGHLVAAFGDGGTATVDLPASTRVADTAVRMADGSFVLGGVQLEPVAGEDFESVAAIARIDGAGHLDRAFGMDGIATIDVPGSFDRVAGIDEMTDGRIAVLVWSHLESITWECDYHDRATLVFLDARGQTAFQQEFMERNGFATQGCRTALTLHALPDGSVLYGSEIGISDGSRMLTSPIWRYGPFAYDPTLGLIVSEVESAGINVPFTASQSEGTGLWRDIGWAAGYPGAITWNRIAIDEQRGFIYAGFSNDGGQAGIARFRIADGSLDTGWNGDGIVPIEGSGKQIFQELDYGLATDVRMIDVQTDGAIVVATADGIVERLKGGSDPAAGAFILRSRQVMPEPGTAEVEILREGGSAGAVSVDFELVDCSAVANAHCTAADAYSEATPGEDFETQSGRLDWADGDSTSRTVTVQALADGRAENNEQFFLRLTNPTGNAAIVSSPIALLIQDSGQTDSGPRGGTIADTTPGGGGAFDLRLALALLVLVWLQRRFRHPAINARSAP